ncbi:hypothetical protein AgCh_013997 [Apium graveolens]
MDTEMGLLWKAKIEKMYEEVGEKEVVFFSAEDEAKFEEKLKELETAKKTHSGDARRQIEKKRHEEGGHDDEFYMILELCWLNLQVMNL